jgi:hypothetical protein
MAWPFTYAALSENRNATIAAGSSGISRRGDCTDARISVRHSSVILASAALVRIPPAATEFCAHHYGGSAGVGDTITWRAIFKAGKGNG